MDKSNNTGRLFKNPFLERLSRSNVLVLIVTFFILSFAILIYGIIRVELNIFIKLAIYISGFLSFSLVEYVMHRFVYHSGHYTDEHSWQYKVHGIHHAYPHDKERLAVPLPAALILATVFFLFFWLLMRSNTLLFFPGFILGYSFYHLVHYLIHTKKPPHNMFRFLWKHHHVHHHKFDNKAFGVTTPIWDIIFRTMPSKKMKSGIKTEA